MTRPQRSPYRALGIHLERAFVVGTLLLMAKFGMVLFYGGDDAIDQEQGSTAYQVLAALAYAVTFVLVAVRHRQFLKLCRKNWAVVILVILALLSVFWSVQPAVTLRRSLAITGTTLFGFYIALRYEPREFLRLAAVALGIMVIGSVLAVALVPDLGIHSDRHEGAWRGLFSHKNAFGRFMALGVLVFLIRLLGPNRRRWLSAIGLVICGSLVILSESRTAWVVTAALLLAYPVLSIARAHVFLAIAASGVAVTMFGGALIWMAANAEALFALLGRDLSLTGRIPLWIAAFQDVLDRPILGHGYRAYWLGEFSPSAEALYMAGWIQLPTHGHNAFLDLWLELGALGLAAFVVFIVICVHRAFVCLRSMPGTTAAWYVLALIYVLLFGLPGGEMFTQNSFAWVLLVVTSIHAGHYGTTRQSLLTRGSSQTHTLDIRRFRGEEAAASEPVRER